MIEIALYQPDIAANTAAIMRLCACLGVKLAVIEPAGFTWSDSSLRRVGLDYLDKADLTRDRSWTDFRQRTAGRRTVLITTKAGLSYTAFRFLADDVLLLGRESAGVPDTVQEAAEARLLIPMRPGLRSLNVAMACAMVTGEALRQLEQFPR
jgi:tRNA (cytidine/uridine-2'-O-)-methyltransferase